MATVAKAIHDHILRSKGGMAAAPTSFGGKSSVSSTDTALPSNVALEMENDVSPAIFRFLNKNRRSAAADFLNSTIPRPSSTMAPSPILRPQKSIGTVSDIFVRTGMLRVRNSGAKATNTTPPSGLASILTPLPSISPRQAPSVHTISAWSRRIDTSWKACGL